MIACTLFRASVVVATGVKIIYSLFFRSFFLTPTARRVGAHLGFMSSRVPHRAPPLGLPNRPIYLTILNGVRHSRPPGAEVG